MSKNKKVATKPKSGGGGSSSASSKQQAYTYYHIEKSNIRRLKKECPRCKGSFLAEHKDRRHCGSCGYTEFKTKGSN